MANRKSYHIISHTHWDRLSMFTRPDPNAMKPRLPQSGTFMIVDGDAIVSAVKWSEDGHYPMIRLFNAEENAASIYLHTVYGENEIIQRTCWKSH